MTSISCRLSFIGPQKNLFSSTKKKKHCLPAFNAIFFNARWRQVDNRIVNNLQKHWQYDILPFRSSQIKPLVLLYFQGIKTKRNLIIILICLNVFKEGILFNYYVNCDDFCFIENLLFGLFWRTLIQKELVTIFAPF